MPLHSLDTACAAIRARIYHSSSGCMEGTEREARRLGSRIGISVEDRRCSRAYAHRAEMSCVVHNLVRRGANRKVGLRPSSANGIEEVVLKQASYLS